MSGVPAATIYGIFGAIRLHSGLHIVVITKVKKIGQIKGQDVFRVLEARTERLGRNNGLTPVQVEDDATFVKMLNSVLAEDCLSPAILLTLSHPTQKSLLFPPSL